MTASGTREVYSRAARATDSARSRLLVDELDADRALEGARFLAAAEQLGDGLRPSSP